MAYPQSILRVLCGLALLLACAEALHFDLMAVKRHDSKSERCIRNFVSRDTLVMVTSTVSGHKGDGMQVNIHIKDAVGNEYARAKDVAGEKRMAFTSLADSAFDVCFENILYSNTAPQPHTRKVELDVDIGADAKDWSAIQATEKLKPVETELRRIEEMVQEIVNEMDYLRTREQKLRDTNESTNNRVKWFGFGTIGMLMALGAWQIVYLRAYFR
ncbi:vesicle coat component [Pseudogymnoascus australis]